MRQAALLCLIGLLFLSFNTQSIQTHKGQVVSIQKYNLVNKPTPYMQFILNADGEEYTVELGPEWYMEEQGIILVPREEIEVTGSLVSSERKKIIVASSIKKGKRQLKLRQENGKPVWENH